MCAGDTEDVGGRKEEKDGVCPQDDASGERGDVRVAERKREESGIELSPPSLAC